MGRWDHLYETKAQPVRDWALGELAAQLEAELAKWPLPGLDWIDETEQTRLRDFLARTEPPPRGTLRVALELARLELLHEIEKVDFFLRSDAAHALLPGVPGQGDSEQAALFLSRWLLESCWSIQEAAPGKLKRRDLVELVERLEKRILGTEAPLRI